MLRLFVDANTLISGLLFSGNESQLFDYARLGLCELLTVEHVRAEVRRILREPRLSLTPQERGRALRILSRHVTVLEDPSVEKLRGSRGRVRDTHDLPVVIGFEESGCDYLVTGDRDLLGQMQRVISTKRALTLFRQNLG